MNGGDHGQPPLDGGISGGLDLDALVGLKASGRIQEGADEIRSQEAGGFVVSQRKVSVSPGRAILGGVRTSTREHHPAEHTGISQPGDLTRRELGVMGLDNAAAPVDRQVLEDLDSEATRVALVDGQPAAVAFVFVDENPTVVAETVQAGTPAGDNAVASAMSSVITWAEDAGYKRINFDGHRSDPHFGPLASRLPLEGASLNLMEISVLPADDAGDPADGGATVA